MADSSGSKKRSRESDASDYEPHAFDEELSDEFQAERHSSASSIVLNCFTRGAAETSDSDGERPPAPVEHNFRVYGYDEHGERLPSEQVPRPPRAQATQAAPGLQPQGQGHVGPMAGDARAPLDGGGAD
jgi:hypothetical protein